MLLLMQSRIILIISPRSLFSELINLHVRWFSKFSLWSFRVTKAYNFAMVSIWSLIPSLHSISFNFWLMLSTICHTFVCPFCMFLILSVKIIRLFDAFTLFRSLDSGVRKWSLTFMNLIFLIIWVTLSSKSFILVNCGGQHVECSPNF